MARQIAKCPGYTTQSGALLNSILQELASTYDFDQARGSTVINLGEADSSIVARGGPYDLPEDYWRSDPNDVFYTIQGVPYCLIAISVSEYDNLVFTPGMQNYPTNYTTRLEFDPPQLWVWMPASGNYPLTVRYRRNMPDIDTPETSTETPWFPSATYLYTRLAGELMKITDDDRAERFLGGNPDVANDMGAQAILGRYLKLANDKSRTTNTVMLDRRRFGTNFQNLKNTKYVGW
jgi:hypothetical protein